jgi:hypothetical protein
MSSGAAKRAGLDHRTGAEVWSSARWRRQAVSWLDGRLAPAVHPAFAEIAVGWTTPGWFRDGLVEDLVLVLTLAGTTPAWP